MGPVIDMKLPLTLACGIYDRTYGLFDGTIPVEGVELNPIALPPGELFRRQARHAEFDVSEFSLATLMILHDRGDERMIGIPVYPSRRFRHEHIWVNSSSSIDSPADLAGKRIGVQEFIQTAAVWIRGHLHDDFGIGVEDIEWYTGGYNNPEPAHADRIAFASSKDIRLRVISSDTSINEMLIRGELDAAFPSVPEGFRKNNPNIRRLYADFSAVEKDYYSRTGIFPIMHLVVIRRSLYEQFPWVAVSIQKAFEAARRQAFDRLDTYPGPLYVSLPWLTDHLSETRHVLGEDYWSYGFAENAHVMSTLSRHLFEQGLIRREIDDVSVLFAAETTVR